MAAVVPGDARISIVSGRDVIAADLGRERLGAYFFTGFGLVALSLAVAGVFGLIAYLAQSRRQEFGIRSALGATPAALVQFALFAGLGPALVGATLGLAGAAWLGQIARSFLVGVGSTDLVSYAGVFTLVMAIATVAGGAAAWRLRRLSLIEALRAE
jgi:ABC-type antimicrobial peptide transport system permease subunit